MESTDLTELYCKTVLCCFRGIWLWKGDFPGDPGRCLVLLDVEGLADADKGDETHDLNLFVLSLLASSLFVYNTKGTIDAKVRFSLLVPCVRIFTYTCLRYMYNKLTRVLSANVCTYKRRQQSWRGLLDFMDNLFLFFLKF